MTGNTQGLDEILGRLQEATIVTYAKETLDGVNYRSHHANRAKAKQALLDWRNKQTGAVLDRLEAEMNRFTSKHDIPMRDEALSAIEAERNKPRESSNDKDS